jgi:4a-hydroxytetrahydrobiopterin dehydratase
VNGIHEVGSSILPGSTKLKFTLKDVLEMKIPGWREENHRLCRDFQFEGFPEAFAFMTRVALAAAVQDHHPDWSNVYGLVSVRLSTHDLGNVVTEKDYSLALAINSIAGE